MYDPPAYLWAITIAGTAAIAAATCLVLYSGAKRAGLGRRRAALLAGAAAVMLGGWFTASAVIAGHGWYNTRLGHGVPWLPIAVAGFFGTLLALRRIPVVARALRHRAWRAAWTRTFRWKGGLPDHDGLGHLRAVRLARGPGRHRWHRRAAGRVQARAERAATPPCGTTRSA